MRVLVTGGAGFIGSYVVPRLLSAGQDVTVLDNLSTGDRVFVPKEANLIVGDIRDPEAVNRACRGHNAIVHLAAMVSVSDSVVNPAVCHDINVFGTRNVLETARRSGITRVVLASTAAVYGNDPCLPKREDLQPQPVSPYAFSKLLNELDAQFEAKFLGLEAVCLRFFNVYGPRQRPDSPYAGVISIAANRLIRGEKFIINGDGKQTRDFIYVDDVATCIVEALVRPDLRYEVINIGRGERIDLLSLIATLEQAVGCPAQLDFGPERAGDVRHSVAYVGRMRTVLGAKANVSLLDGLIETVDWMRRDGKPSGV